jgi:hypothetical protein
LGFTTKNRPKIFVTEKTIQQSAMEKTVLTIWSERKGIQQLQVSKIASSNNLQVSYKTIANSSYLQRKKIPTTHSGKLMEWDFMDRNKETTENCHG